MNIALVGCVKGKRSEACAAADLYTSPLFVLSRRYAERFDAWAILSARHGLLMPGTQVGPYEETLTTMKAEQVRAWWSMVGRQLREAWPGCGMTWDPTFTCLAGSRYLGCMTGLRYRDPMRRFGIGERLRWLKVASEHGDVDAAACCAHGASRHQGGGRCDVPGCTCLHLITELHRTRRA